MENGECCESYPWWMVVLSNLVSLGIYGLGSYVIYQVGWPFMAVYLAFIAALEIRLLKGHCVHCYYHGKRCAFGKGKLSGLLFKAGEPGHFTGMKLTWWSLLPDMLVSLVPVVVGIIVLIDDFSWWVLAAVVLIVVLASAGNSFVRGRLACKHCKQRELGCPAEKLFQKAGAEETG